MLLRRVQENAIYFILIQDSKRSPLTKSIVLLVRSFIVKTMSPESVSRASFIVSLYLQPLLITWTRLSGATSWPFIVQQG